jgi:hypothetical protein
MTYVSKTSVDNEFVVQPILKFAAALPVDDPLRRYLKPGDPGQPSPETIASEFFADRLPLELDPRQVVGDWYAPLDKPLAAVPTWYPTGALLPRLGEVLRPGAEVLTLVAIDYVWVPLSVAGMHTYSHSAGLARQEHWQFAPRPSPDYPWPTVLLLELAGEVAPDAIVAEFGVGASRRARADKNAVLLRLRAPV